MTALAADRMTPRRAATDVYHYDVKGAAKIYAGALTVLNAGYAAPGSVATGLVAVGRAEHYADNSAGTNGDIKVKVRAGIFRFANSAAADQITRAEIGANCYVVDDQTVAKTDGSAARSVAGKVVDVDGVWVATGPGGVI
ncbi:hypothetical protein AAFX91_21785 [Bradyrhizobium sp. 31Argb]|uniref:hypothetical protein n=1 Tax=Bradyrhizobium sp. 31Argb TaxID=3141247 RepID=UPI00374A1842